LAAQGLHFFAPHWAIWTGRAVGFAFAAGSGAIVDIAATVTMTAPVPAIAGNFDDASSWFLYVFNVTSRSIVYG
jgi:hypothetical protein